MPDLCSGVRGRPVHSGLRAEALERRAVCAHMADPCRRHGEGLKKKDYGNERDQSARAETKTCVGHRHGAKHNPRSPAVNPIGYDAQGSEFESAAVNRSQKA